MRMSANEPGQMDEKHPRHGLMICEIEVMQSPHSSQSINAWRYLTSESL